MYLFQDRQEAPLAHFVQPALEGKSALALSFAPIETPRDKTPPEPQSEQWLRIVCSTFSSSLSQLQLDIVLNNGTHGRIPRSLPAREAHMSTARHSGQAEDIPVWL